MAGSAFTHLTHLTYPTYLTYLTHLAGTLTQVLAAPWSSATLAR